jgi:4-aminobutyrate aminotransferase-like enzyme
MAMTLGGLGPIKEGYGPLVGDVVHAPFPYSYRCDAASLSTDHDCSNHCLAALQLTIDTELDGPPAAIIMEPYLGAGGSLVAPLAFVRGVRRLCDQTGALMIVDEVQSSFGRTGTMFAFEQWDIQPDILVVAKGIASGVPTSAIMMRRDLYEAMPHGALSSTFGGNPLSCAAALATLDVLRDEALPERAGRLGEFALASLRSTAATVPLIGDVRGMGLALGVELVRDPRTKQPAVVEARAVAQLAIERGVFVLQPIGLYGNVIRLAPPLTIKEDELSRGLDILRGAFEEVGAAMVADEAPARSSTRAGSQ